MSVMRQRRPCNAVGCDADAYDVGCGCATVSIHPYCEKHLTEQGWNRDSGCWRYPAYEDIMARLGWDDDNEVVRLVKHRLSNIYVFYRGDRGTSYLVTYCSGPGIEVVAGGAPAVAKLPGHAYSAPHHSPYSSTLRDVFVVPSGRETKSAKKGY